MGAYLPSSALPGLKNYKYAGEDRSLISKYILKPFYVRAVGLLPMWIAPNMVTLLGLFFSVVSFVAAWFYNQYSDASDPPRWIYFLHAVDLFLYQTLDALDGQQARRTGTSSPLGELFDHCVDAINTSLQAYVVSSVLCLPKFYVLLGQFLCTLNFFLSTWEEYHTHRLFLSAFSGPVEGILLLIIAEIITGFTGPALWFETFSVFGYDLSIRDFASFGMGIGLVFNSGTALNNVRLADRGKFARNLVGLAPLFIMWIGYGGWAWLSWETVDGDGFLPFFLSAGFTFALLVGRIITAHVTSQNYPMWTPLLAGPYLGVMLHIISPETDICSIWGILGLSIGVYESFVAEVISEITNYLDIGCLYIKKRVKKND